MPAAILWLYGRPIVAVGVTCSKAPRWEGGSSSGSSWPMPCRPLTGAGRRMCLFWLPPARRDAGTSAAASGAASATEASLLSQEEYLLLTSRLHQVGAGAGWA